MRRWTADGVRRERDTTDLPGAKNVADVSFTAPDGLPVATTEDHGEYSGLTTTSTDGGNRA